jgi:hypothetical protein
MKRLFETAGFASDENIAKFTDPSQYELGEQHKGKEIKILRIKRVYSIKPVNYYFKSPAKIVHYFPVKITIERIEEPNEPKRDVA